MQSATTNPLPRTCGRTGSTPRVGRRDETRRATALYTVRPHECRGTSRHAWCLPARRRAALAAADDGLVAVRRTPIAARQPPPPRCVDRPLVRTRTVSSSAFGVARRFSLTRARCCFLVFSSSHSRTTPKKRPESRWRVLGQKRLESRRERFEHSPRNGKKSPS